MKRPTHLLSPGRIARAAPMLLALAIAAGPAAGEEPPGAERLLEEAFFIETALSDPAEAGARYRALLERPELPLRVAALAHLRLGICLELKEDWDGAEREFRTVAERFSSEADAALVARRRLGQAPRDPARFMPPDLIAYLEVVEPGQQAAFLSELIRGTPLENPVDYYLLNRARSEAGEASRPPGQTPGSPELNQLRSVLNLSVLKELEKLEGFALGIAAEGEAAPGEDKGPGEEKGVAWLLLFLPGSSDLSRVIVKAALPQAMDGSAPESFQGMRIFKLKREPLHVAMDEGEHVVLLGKSREMVVEAIRRAARPAGRRRQGEEPRALDEVDDFHRAQAARAGSMLFAYADREKALAALRHETPREELAAFDEVTKLLGLDHLRGVAATVARVGDDLRLTLRARIDPQGHPLWTILRTPPLGAGGPRFVPGEALGFFSTAVVDGEERWTRLRSALAPLIAGLPAGKGAQEVRSLLEFLDSGLEMDFGRDFLGELRGLTVAVPSRLHRPPGLSFYLTLEFRDGDVAAPRVERLLAAVARKAFGRAAPVEFQNEAPRGPVALRSFEPHPGFRGLYGREGPTFIVSPLESVVLEAAGSLDRETAGVRSPAPALASKVLALRPQAIRLLRGPREPRDGGEALISSIPRAVFFTEESQDGLAIELRIPAAARAISDALKVLKN